MSSSGLRQSVVSDFFSVRKRPADQHPAKKRKIHVDEDVQDTVVVAADREDGAQRHKDHKEEDSASTLAAESVVTSAISDHLPGVYSTPSAKDRITASKNGRGSKRNSVQGVTVTQDNDDEVREPQDGNQQAVDRLDLGKSVKKRLELGGSKKPEETVTTAKRSNSTRKQRIQFRKEGILSPQKNKSAGVRAPPSFSAPAFNFEKKAALTPNKGAAAKAHEKPAKVLLSPTTPTKEQQNKLAPAEMKRQLGTVNKLSDLKANLAKAAGMRAPGQRPPSTQKGPAPPRLSRAGFDVEVLSPTKRKTPMKSPAKTGPSAVKASPRKKLDFGGDDASTAPAKAEGPTARTPLPRRYRLLLHSFKTLDFVLSQKIRHHSDPKVEAIRPEVQNGTKRNFTDAVLRQIACVAPDAFEFEWVNRKSRMGESTAEYDLVIRPKYRSATSSGQRTMELLKREKSFEATLFGMVKDQHAEFLKERNLDLGGGKVRVWHEDFDVESDVADVDEAQLPTKPDVQKVTKASDLLATTNYHRMEQAIKEQKERERKAAEEKEKREPADKKPERATTSAKSDDLKDVPVALRGLDPALIERLRAKEKQKQVWKMTEDSEHERDRKMLQELIKVGPQIANCYKSRSLTERKTALVSKDFFKFVAFSNGGKSAREMEGVVRTFVKKAPEFLSFINLRGTEYVRPPIRGAAPLERVEIEKKFKELLKQAEKARGGGGGESKKAS